MAARAKPSGSVLSRQGAEVRREPASRVSSETGVGRSGIAPRKQESDKRVSRARLGFFILRLSLGQFGRASAEAQSGLIIFRGARRTSARKETDGPGR